MNVETVGNRIKVGMNLALVVRITAMWPVVLLVKIWRYDSIRLPEPSQHAKSIILCAESHSVEDIMHGGNRCNTVLDSPVVRRVPLIQPVRLRNRPRCRTSITNASNWIVDSHGAKPGIGSITKDIQILVEKGQCLCVSDVALLDDIV